MQWPFSQFVAKSQNLKILKIIDLWTTEENISLIINFCGEIATTSKTLNILHLDFTNSSSSDGEKMWTTLADDDDFVTLTNITLIDESKWFERDCEECMTPFLVVLARQKNLNSLCMKDNDLSESQAQRI